MPGLAVILREAPEREPDLIIESKLLVLLEKTAIQLVVIGKALFLRPNRFIIHVCEVFGQADHLSTFFCALTYEPLTYIKVLVNIFGGLELNDTNYTLEIILLR